MDVMRQYEMNEWSFPGAEPEGSWAETDLTADFTISGKTAAVRGFYAGNGTYRVRFYPEAAGVYQVRVTGTGLGGAECFEAECLPAAEGKHGLVRADGTHFRCADGTWFCPFGTTVYALSHQEDGLVERTFAALSENPFNKVRMCIFPKHYDYNHNDPPCYAFLRKEGAPEEAAGYTADDPLQWDVHRPNPVFWDRLEGHIARLGELGIQADLILFHPYDRWGFSKFRREEAAVYLDYLTRRLSAFPNVWWSLANEYDLMDYQTADWLYFAQYIHDHDPYGHLLSNHEMIIPWDYANENTTHICHQTRAVDMLSPEITKFGKPLMVDEMGYEGDLTQGWGNLSGRQLVRQFWQVCTQGGYATHGETFRNPDDIIWWAKGGTLTGDAPARIRFLREILEEIGGPLTFRGRDVTEEQFYAMRTRIPLSAAEGNPVLRLMLTAPWEQAKGLVLGSRAFFAGYGEQAFLKYYDLQCVRTGTIELPETGSYRIEVIGTWEMTRTVVRENANGTVEIDMPGREGMAILAVRQD